MLQSLGMVIHPPLLFVGFSGFLVPFALALTGLITRDDQAVWQERAVPWIRLSWLFLTAGIVTGGHWAYTELGWGGYWAWDPVENASLFPWLTSTALLHLAILPKECRFKRIGDSSLFCLLDDFRNIPPQWGPGPVHAFVVSWSNFPSSCTSLRLLLSGMVGRKL